MRFFAEFLVDPLPNDGGTSIRMTYDFYQILKSDGTPLDGGMMAKLLSQATRGWFPQRFPGRNEQERVGPLV